MKTLKFFATAAVLFGCTMFANTAQAQTTRGTIRNAVFTAKPAEGNNGYEVQITLKYRFQLCAGDITLDGFRTAHEPLAYWYNGKRYTEAEIKGGCKFKTGKDDLYKNLDFTADVLNEFTGRKVGSGKWIWVNLPDWGGCLGDYGAGGFKYSTAGISGNAQDYIKGMIPMLYLKNIKPKDTPSRDYEIEKCIEGKTDISITSSPDNAEVYIDGALKGTTPLSLKDMKAGTYALEVKKAEYDAYKKTITVVAGKGQTINAELGGDCVEINGVCWATKNLGANSPQDFGGYYTLEEALKLCPDGWRLPTKSEFEAFLESKKLILPKAGYDGGEDIKRVYNNFENVYAYYWTGTTANNGAYCYLSYYGNCNEIRGGDSKFSVRLVRK